jgi:hypothetical protein
MKIKTAIVVVPTKDNKSGEDIEKISHSHLAAAFPKLRDCTPVVGMVIDSRVKPLQATLEELKPNLDGETVIGVFIFKKHIEVLHNLICKFEKTNFQILLEKENGKFETHGYL